MTPTASTSGSGRRPERAYERDFFESFAAEVGWRLS